MSQRGQAGRLADYWPEPASGVRVFLRFEYHYNECVVKRDEWRVPLSRGEYAQFADSFVESIPSNPHIQWFAETSGSVTVYDPQTMELATVAENGDIVTYFLADDAGYYGRKLAEQLTASFILDWGVAQA